MEEKKRPLTAKEKKQLQKRRKKTAKQARDYHKAQMKNSSSKSSDNKAKKQRASVSYYQGRKKVNKLQTENENIEYRRTNSKIINAVNIQQQNTMDDNISREERFRLESEKKIRNLEPKDFDDGGYYVDEFAARKKQERRAKEIRNQESEVIRRHKKHKTPKQVRRLRILLYSGIFAVVLIVGVILSLTVLFKTEKIEVEGDNYYYDEQIIAFSNVVTQENIFIAAMNSTPQEIIDNLPYVEDVKIEFSVPDTITIKVTDAIPSYVIGNGDSYLLISSKGRILESVAENTDNLPELICDELKSTKIGDYVSFSDSNVPNILQDISESLETNSVTDITGFDVTNTANITLNYDNRILIKLGLPEDIDYKIRTAMTIINEKLDPNNTRTVTGTLDVSTCNTTKMSHYKPAETTVAATEATTEPVTAAADDTWDDYSDYSWDADTYSDDYSWDNYSYDSYDYDTYDDNSSYDDYDSYDYSDYYDYGYNDYE